MSELKRLMDTLCPDGVEYKKLGDIAVISRGGSLQKSDFQETGVPCIHYGQIYTKYDLFTSKTLTFISPERAKRQKMAEPGDIVMAVTSENLEDVCKCVAWLGQEKVAVSGHTAIIHHNQNTKFLTYYFQTEAFFAQKRKLAHGTKVIEITPSRLNDVIVPVPPLAVQSEIVRLLDNFTALTAALTAELAARKIQYEHYRDALLTFPAPADDIGKLGGLNNIQWMKLGDICDLSAGGDVPKDRFSKEKSAQYTIPIYSNGVGENALYGFTDIAKISTPCVTIAARGTIGYSELREEAFYPIIRLICAVPKKSVLPRYLKYAVQTLHFHVPTSGIPQLTVPNVAKYKIPVPPLAEQERIVAILDKFDALVNDISRGLPAEIDARRKQYAYYRDRLLDFREKRE